MPPSTLPQLFLSLFDVEALRRHLREGPNGQAVVNGLPSAPATPAEVADKAAELLTQQGLLDREFFVRLTTERPRRVADIERIRSITATADGPPLCAPSTEVAETTGRSKRLAALATTVALAAVLLVLVVVIPRETPSVLTGSELEGWSLEPMPREGTFLEGMRSKALVQAHGGTLVIWADAPAAGEEFAVLAPDRVRERIGSALTAPSVPCGTRLNLVSAAFTLSPPVPTEPACATLRASCLPAWQSAGLSDALTLFDKVCP